MHVFAKDGAFSSQLEDQAIVADEDLVVEIPKYTINHAAEKNH